MRTRTQLLDAATRVIAERGLEAVSVEDFVAAAGVARGTFYNYFPTVDDLVQALTAHLAESMAGDLEAIVAEVVSPTVRIAALAHYFLSLAEEDGAWGWVMLRLALSRAPRQPLIEARFDAYLSEGLSQGELQLCDPAAARALIFGAVRMAQRDLLMGEAPAGHAHNVVVLVLTALGAAPDRIEGYSRQGEQQVAQVRGKC